MIKPIKPDEVVGFKLPEKIIPEEVIESVNELIARNWQGKSARLDQYTLVDLIKTKLKLIDDKLIYENRWLDFEDMYRESGWNVVYNKPAYYETFSPSFMFTKK